MVPSYRIYCIHIDLAVEMVAIMYPTLPHKLRPLMAVLLARIVAVAVVWILSITTWTIVMIIA